MSLQKDQEEEGMGKKRKQVSVMRHYISLLELVLYIGHLRVELQQYVCQNNLSVIFWYELGYKSIAQLQILYIQLLSMEQNEEKSTTFNQFALIPMSIGQLPMSFGVPFFNLPGLGPLTHQQHGVPCQVIQNQQITGHSLEYFKSFFSPKETAKSLQRRNQNLEMLSFENSDGQEPDDVYNRRRKKVCDLMTQEQEQVQTILNIRKESQNKYDAIIAFVKFFCLLKQSIPNIRTDYYSSKTFCALKNASEQEIINVTKVMAKMYHNVSQEQLKTCTSFQYVNSQPSQITNRIIEFLIIPRFLISKEKIVRLIRDEELQKNFEFLVMHQCLGHYNNEANKKMPEQNHMKYVRELLVKKSGREKFKKICSINHGNKFLKSHGAMYYSLYSQNINYLQHLDTCLKKGKKFESIKKDLQKMAKESEQTVGNSSFTENESSYNGIYQFISFGECLNKIQKEDGSLNEQRMDEPLEIDITKKAPTMQKRMIKKIMSTPIQEQQQRQVLQNRRFQVRKFKTMQQKMEQNIILIPPPHYSEI